MRKSVLAATVVSVPLVAIAVREIVRLFGGLTDPRRAGTAPILWIFGVFVTMTVLWIGVYLLGRVRMRDPNRLSFEATAAIAIAEARKRGPAGKCDRCGRPRQAGKATCLYCGAGFGDAAPAAGTPGQ